MAGLVPAIHGLLSFVENTWMPGTSPGMTGWQGDTALVFAGGNEGEAAGLTPSAPGCGR